MFHHTETKLQGWRALAVLEDGSECLLYVGRSAPHVRAEYEEAFLRLLDGSERARVLRISLECWQGVADRGRWIPKTTLALPTECQPVVNRLAAAPGPIDLAGADPCSWN